MSKDQLNLVSQLQLQQLNFISYSQLKQYMNDLQPPVEGVTNHGILMEIDERFMKSISNITLHENQRIMDFFNI